MKEYIKLLDLPEEFDLQDLKKAYRKKVLQYHPDKAGNEAERIGYEATMKKLNEANTYLKEYLENHGGKYSKDTETYNYSDDNSTEEEQDEFNYEEDKADVNNEEHFDEDDPEEKAEENSAYNTVKDMSVLEQIIYVTKLILNPNCLKEELNNKGVNISDFNREVNKTIIKSVIAGLILAIIYFAIIPEDTIVDNNISQQETVTRQNNIDTTTTHNKDIVADNRTELGRYMGEVQSRIKANWVIPPEVSASGIDYVKITVAFTVFKDGRLVGEPTIKQSSGVSKADELCIQAVKQTAPFKPLPPDIKKDYVDMEFTFEAARN